MISGLAYLIKKVGELFEDNDFIKKMETIDPEEIIKLGRTLSVGNTTHGRDYSLAILKFYNKGRTTKKIPESLLFD